MACMTTGPPLDRLREKWDRLVGEGKEIDVGWLLHIFSKSAFISIFILSETKTKQRSCANETFGTCGGRQNGGRAKGRAKRRHASRHADGRDEVRRSSDRAIRVAQGMYVLRLDTQCGGTVACLLTRTTDRDEKGGGSKLLNFDIAGVWPNGYHYYSHPTVPRVPTCAIADGAVY